jgi:nucleoside phosphorylase
VFGCDTDLFGDQGDDSGTITRTSTASLSASSEGANSEELPVAEDMETAAVAAEAAARSLPFIAFRAVSDGAGDPLGLPGFPAQFFAYYPLAADNAAAAATAFLERVRSR